MSNELEPAIQLLRQKLEDAEQQVVGIRGALNMLLDAAGLPPVDAGGDKSAAAAGENGASLDNIRSDTFYGKRQQTAVREFLEMRQKAGLGAAKPREIYDALKLGGFKYEAKTDDTAIVGLRALLRKRSHIFHKLPNGAYGLAVWYPHAKKTSPKSDAGGEHDAADDEDIEIVESASAASDEDAADD